MLVFLLSSVVVSVATTAATTADYPDDKVTLPPATTGRPVRTQATQGSPRVRKTFDTNIRSPMRLGRM